MSKFLFVLILLLSILVRFWRLGIDPPGVLVDEASFGYNSYSVLETGRDEWGERFPLTLRSFGDFKPAGYIYLTIPFIRIFGLNSLSTRLPSAIFGIFAIVCIYLIVKLLIKNNNLALISSFILSIAPWHIYMSRMAWDSNIALGFLLLGFTFFLYANKQNRLIFFIFASLFFSLTYYSYVGYRIVTSLFLFTLIIFYFYNKLIKVKNILFFTFFFLVFCLPLIPEVLYKGALTRFNQVNIFTQYGNVLFINEQRAFCGMQNNKLLLGTCYLIWNKPLVALNTLLKRYFSAFSNDFLFFAGDSALFINNPEHGGLYYWLSPFFIIGLLFLIKQFRKTNYQFIFWWFLISPVMPVIAGKPHYERANLMLIPLSIICSIGITTTKDFFWKRFRIRNLFIVFITIISLLSIFVTMLDYFFIYTKKALVWDEYWAPIYNYLSTVESNYERIYVKKINERPYIYMLFYQAVNPLFFRSIAEKQGFEVLSVGKYKFIDNGLNYVYCRWVKEGKPKTIMVTDEGEPFFAPVKIIRSFNEVHIRAVIYDLEKTDNYLKINNQKISGCEE